MSNLKLTVKHGKSTYEVMVDDSDLVSGVLQRIEHLTGIPTREQKLVCQGKVLPPTSSLQASKVKSGAKLMLLAGGSQTQGQVAAQQVIKEKAAAAKEPGEAFKQKRHAKANTAAPAYTMQDRANRWASVGIASLRDEHLDILPEALWTAGMSIRVADLGGNKLTDVPASMAVLNGLQRLRLSYNQLTSEGIPWTALAAMPQLAVLALDHNRLTSLPDAIGQLTQLQKLSLGHNAIPSLPGTVSCLIKLEHLDLSHNSLQALPQELGSCTALAELHAEHNQLSSLPNQLSALLSLKTLGLDSNRLTVIPAELLQGCTSLFTLSVHQNPITSAALREMVGFAEFDVRRRSKYNRQMEMRVMTPTGGFDEGADAEQWQHWGR